MVKNEERRCKQCIESGSASSNGMEEVKGKDNFSRASPQDSEQDTAPTATKEENTREHEPSEGMTIKDLEGAIKNPNTSADERKQIKKRLKKKRQKERKKQTS